ncbi:TIGR04206 family protein [Haloarcula nitratireducens]|uniref:TIGR04206 family protein n=1 Tax=Haloarcula nitratireducens TaxID=2487749 RepID=A0AAW4PA54_9EURY|nr:TIGR04206 family protein [Halomicroarcula nitratireducens]MBX0294637.1 TIGR04206 family protein [Halomicroarcula nitratireducens]
MVAGPRRRLFAVVVAGLVPWTVLFVGGELTILFTFGLFTTSPPELLPIYDYFFRFTRRLPRFIESWGTGVLLYLLALASALSGAVWREDPRITALSLVGAALSQIGVVLGFSRRIGYVALPVGTVVLLGVAWWYYWPLLGFSADGEPATE